MRDGLDFSGGAHGLIRGEATLGVDQVGGEDGVDQGRLSQTSLSYYERSQHGFVQAR